MPRGSSGPSLTGQPIQGAPGEGNFGQLQSGALEESNVDLTAELVNMMTAQRAYQANAQTIKTQDQVHVHAGQPALMPTLTEPARRRPPWTA